VPRVHVQVCETFFKTWTNLTAFLLVQLQHSWKIALAKWKASFK
jgi:hypothetical protein